MLNDFSEQMQAHHSKHVTGKRSKGVVSHPRNTRTLPGPPFLLTLTLTTCLTLVACGAGSESKSKATKAATTQASTSPTTSASTTTTPSQPPEPTSSDASLKGLSPDKPVASVAHHTITVAELVHELHLRSPSEPIPDPPSYESCIAHGKASAKPTSGSAPPSEAQLKQGCRKRYHELLQSALGTAIHNQWLSGEAAEEGIHITNAQVEEELQAAKRQFQSAAEFKAYLKSSGQTLADMKREIKFGKVTDAIFKHIASKEHPATDATVASYYQAHKGQYAIPEGRDLRIVRTTTEGSAVNAKRELQQGKSFAAVAKELSAIGQPLGTKEGQIADLLPNVYEEKKLNDAIFSAKLHRLYGPMKVTAHHKTIAPETNSGFFIFEVVGKVPGRQTPLSKVKASLAQQLTKEDKDKTVATFIAAFRKKWKARTDCRPGFVVPYCKQGASTPTEAADAYTL